MGFIVKAIALILLVGIVVVGVLAYTATSGTARQCPAVQQTAAGSQPREDAAGIVRISNAEATKAGRSYLGQYITDLRVCFDSDGGHASGTLPVGPANLSFFVTGRNVDLSGSSPRINDLDFELGSVPSAVANAAKSTITGGINEALTNVRLAKRYSYQFGDGVVTLRAQ